METPSERLGLRTLIISHQHSFIFLKTRKTASTSVDMALSEHCGSRDVISYLNQADEALKRELGRRTAQNFHVPLRRWTLRDLARFARRGRRPRYTEHMAAASAKQRLDPETWSSYFKFCVERNPFDKAVSLYYWRTREEVSRPGLVEFLRTVDEASLSNAHIYTNGGGIEVNRIIRYERLDEELSELSNTIGIGPLELPRAKGGIRKSRAHYRELLNEEARSIVERVCQREIELLGYEF